MAPDPIDITDEIEPTERMVELQEQAHDRANREDLESSSKTPPREPSSRARSAAPEALFPITLRDDVSGSMTTDDYYISEAIERL